MQLDFDTFNLFLLISSVGKGLSILQMKCLSETVFLTSEYFSEIDKPTITWCVEVWNTGYELSSISFCVSNYVEKLQML